jgi:hypothetical protein
MYPARSILAALYFLSSLGGAKAAFASEDSSPMAMETEASPAFQSSPESNVLRQIAIALAGGSEAMRALRGSPYPDDQRDRLEPPLPGMDCGIDRIQSYVSCYSAVINNEKEAENVFTQLVDDVKAALSSDRWRPIKVMPRLGSSRRISYEDRESGAQIDIELLVQPTTEVQSSYVISLYGWTRI